MKLMPHEAFRRGWIAQPQILTENTASGVEAEVKMLMPPVFPISINGLPYQFHLSGLSQRILRLANPYLN